MRLWLITVGEPLPLPGGRERLLRTGVLAGHLTKTGHEVTWWTSAVDHFRKQFHAVPGPEIRAEPGYDVRLLPGRLYRRNISLDRLRNHHEIAAAFRAAAPTLPRPDLILCSLPTLELCCEATRFGKRHDVPVFLDVRDPWPDVYYQALPRLVRAAGPLLFAPMVREARSALRDATGVLAVSQSYLDWGLRLAGRARGARDAVITHGYPTPPETTAGELDALRVRHAIPAEAFMCWFVGSFAWTYDLGTVIDAARRLSHRSDLVFVLTGAGDREAEWRKRAHGLPNVRFTGWVDRQTIAGLSRLAGAGLVSYTPDAPNSLTNKLFEYMSAGLPLLLGLKGEAETIIREWNCGLVYEPGNADDLARVVVELADNPALRSRLSSGSAQAFRTAFSEEVIYSRLVRYIEKQARVGR